MCRMKGKSADQCQNYIRVLKLQTPETLFVCGTNAYKPRCRTYLITVSLPPSSAPPPFPIGRSVCLPAACLLWPHSAGRPAIDKTMAALWLAGPKQIAGADCTISH